MFHIRSCLTIFAYITHNIRKYTENENLRPWKESTGSEVSKKTAINYNKVPFTFLLC